jgi:alkaline phosphatase D
MSTGSTWPRRGFVKAVVASAAVPWSGCGSSGDPDAPEDTIPEPSPSEQADRVFPQGIASSDPRPDGVLLWTRVEPPAADEAAVVRWYVALDEAFTEPVATGELVAEPEVDHTVRVRLVDLQPYTWYWYRFSVEGPDGTVTTQTGRTKTAPTADMDVPVRFAVTSCQEYVGRWYHAWRRLVEREPELDFVLFLGDYIYESIADPRFQPLDSPRSLTLPDGMSLDGTPGNLVAVTLADYRALYRQYRSDPELRRVHARYPFVVIWDDHEFSNDGWQDVANEFDGERGLERDTARRQAATRAWFEHVPVDVPYDGEAAFPSDVVTYRALRYGRHAELLLTDQRYYRDDHLVPETEAELSVGKLMPNSALGSRILALKAGFDALEAETPPAMLGEAQERWLVDAVSGSDATWKLWASALMMAQLVLDLREVEEAPPLLRNVFYFKLDQWDGFRTERARILSQLAGVRDLVVLSGDLHGNYAAHLRPDFDDPSTPATAVELTVTGISSISLQEQLDTIAATEPMLADTGVDQITHLFDDNLRATGPHFVYANSSAYGYAVVELDGAELRARFEELTRVTDPVDDGAGATVAFRVRSGTNALEPA